MHCALCHQDRTLRRSHIIPEFMYGTLYDEKHRFWVVSIHEHERNELKQKGEREELLCDDCESKFSKFERYASLVHNGGIPLAVESHGRLLVIQGIDYLQFKLFQLSVLWRASVSTLKLFEKVSLGPHEERLRLRLLAENPGEPTEYGCIMWGITLAPGEPAGLMMQPMRLRQNSFVTYKFVFGGVMWVYFVSSRNPGYPYDQCMLSREGKAILQVRGIEEMGDLRKFMEVAALRGKLPREA
jgi:hypothetical protein